MKKGPKIIIDGEIYDGENDPRLLARRAAQQQQQQQQTNVARTQIPIPPRPQHGHVQQPAPVARGFDMNALPFRTVPSPNAILGLPDVEIFGFRLPAVVLMGLVLVAYRLGWRALLGLGGIYYMYKVSQGNQQGAAQPAHPQQHTGQQPQRQHQQAAAGGPGGGLADILGSLGLGTGGNNSSQTGAAGRAQPQAQSQQGSADPGPFRGTSHKLGSA